MQQHVAIPSHSDYVKELKEILPEAAFEAVPGRLWLVLLHLLIVGASYFAFRCTSSIFAFAAISLLIGHSMGCIAFSAHELSHNAIVRVHALRYPLEVFLWGINLIPATIWKRVHNQSHHAHTNTLRDPDRRFLQSEKSTVTTLYSRLLYPNRSTLRWNVLVAFHFVPYILRNILAAFYPNSSKPAVVPFKPTFTPLQRTAILGELCVIVVIQVGIFYAVGARWDAYVWASPVAALITSSVVMAYIFTNHFLKPLTPTPDPLACTTSVIVWPVFDVLHSHFSYHIEHHLFPSMNSDFYPALSKLVQEKWPHKYHRISIGEAWRALWKSDEFLADTVTASYPENSHPVSANSLHNEA